MLIEEPQAPDAPEPMNGAEARAQRLLRLESFYDGLDSVDAKLDPVSREQFGKLVGMSDNGEEARAQAVNKAYVAYTQPQAREAIETQWPMVKAQVAQSLGINKPEVSDSELYGALSQKVKAAQDERQMAAELSASVQLAALEGEADWLTTYQQFTGAMKERAGFDPKHSDDYRRIAEASGITVAKRAHRIGPVVKTVAGLLTEAKDDTSILDNERMQERRDAIVQAVMSLSDPQDRRDALRLAAQKVAREQPETERSGLEKTAQAAARGIKTLTQGLRNTTEAAAATFVPTLYANNFAEVKEVRGELAEKRQILRELAAAYDATVDPVKGKNVVTQGLLNITQMLPQLGLIANPLVGVPLLMASNKDARQGALQAEGVPEAQASNVALVQASIDTALQFVTSNMVFGKTAGTLATSSAKGTGELLKRVAGIGAIETGVLSATTVAQELSPLIVQDMAANLSEAVPGVDWNRELDAMKHALPETIATLLPMVLLGTGAATFRETVKFKDYTADVTKLQAVGFSEDVATNIAAVSDPLKRVEMLREEWPNRQPEPDPEALAALDAEHEASVSQPVNIETNSDGTYKVSSPDGQTTLDGIADPAEAQRAADTIADRQSDPAKALSRLAEAIKPLPEGESATLGQRAAEFSAEAQKTGIAAPMPDWLRPTAARIREIGSEIAGKPKFTPFKEALNKWVGRGQITSLELRQSVRQIERAVPDKVAREGITAWLQANGDKTQLAEWAKQSTHLEYKRGYEAALKLTPEQIKVAERLREFYRDMLVTLQNAGLVDHGVENYVSQIWVKQNPVTGKDQNPAGPRLVTDLKYAKERTFGSYFEGEQLGYVPVTKDISKLMALYSNSVSKVIATREFIKDLTTKKAADGRPLAAPLGNRALSTTAEGDPAFIKPLAKDEATLDYRTIEGQPALTKWKWIGEHNGADAYLEGQLGLHPEIHTHVKNALGRSIIRDWYQERSGPLLQTLKDTVQLVDKLGQVTKGTMLGFFSPFHIVQEGTHAIGHKINPFFNLPELDPANPLVRNAVEHGLMLAGDGEGMRHFKDSIDKNLANRIPVIGELSLKFTEWMFHDYIPQLKLKTYEAIKERNTKRYTKELAAKQTTQGEIDYLSAQQTNAAYGHLNYADLGRNPTFQHIAQIALLAPDFLEARGRFAGQALKGIASKAGQEQLTALAFLALIQWGTARILNKTLDDDYHFDHPFDVVVGNRKYTMRSVPEDIYKLIGDPRRFTMGRISPLIGRGIFQLGTGKNWRGEKVDYSDTFQELATAWIPITLRATPIGQSITASDRANPISMWEQFVGSIGLHISRNSPIASAYRMANEWNADLPEGDANKRKEDKGTYPVSKYQALRYALEDGDADRAAEALKKLRADGGKKITDGFHQSLFKSWTESKAMDAQFKASLAPEDRALVEYAETMRQTIWTRYNLLLQQMANDGTNP
jgi:hypothetical protein